MCKTRLRLVISEENALPEQNITMKVEVKSRDIFLAGGCWLVTGNRCVYSKKVHVEARFVMDKESAGRQMVAELLRDEISPRAKDDMTTREVEAGQIVRDVAAG